MNPMTGMPFDADRLARYRELVFEYGSHDDPAKGYCAMEAYAMLAGETHSDHASCICPTIGAIVRRFNDRVGDKERRTRVLKDLAFVVIGTASTPEVAQLRSWLALDWSLRVATPLLFRLTPSLSEWADKLEACAPVVDNDSENVACAVLYKARGAAWAKRSEAWQRIRAAAVADAAAAAVAVAVAVADAVAAAAAAADIQRIIKAAKEARSKGGGYGAQYNAARAVADEVFSRRPLRAELLAMRDELDAEFIALIKRLTEVREVAS